MGGGLYDGAHAGWRARAADPRFSAAGRCAGPVGIGWAVPGAHAKLAGEDVKGTWNSTINAWQTTIPDSGKGLDLTLEQ